MIFNVNRVRPTGNNTFSPRPSTGRLNTDNQKRESNLTINAMRILCVADKVVPALYENFDRGQFGRIDLILSCGDVPPEYLSFLKGVFGAPLYYILGNHDIRYGQSPPEGCMDIHGRLVRCGSLKILGLAGSRWYNGGPNQYHEWQMRRLVWRLRPRLWWKKGVDIVLTHAPPRHIHDQEDPCHRGFAIYRRLIDWYRPRYFLHGHIHRGFADDNERITSVGTTQVINCFGHYIFESQDS